MYELHAVIADKSLLVARCKSLRESKVVALNSSSLGLLPVTSKLLKELERSVQPTNHRSALADVCFERLSSELISWIISASDKGRIAYVEAEYFGGDGAQKSVIWGNGEVILGPLRSTTACDPVTLELLPSEPAINPALQVLGVVALSGYDEFKTIGLDRHRLTENW